MITIYSNGLRTPKHPLYKLLEVIVLLSLIHVNNTSRDNNRLMCFNYAAQFIFNNPNNLFQNADLFYKNTNYYLLEIIYLISI